MRVERIHALPADLTALVESARAESFPAVARMQTEWERGENRFEKPGEALFEARAAGRLVGVCGLNRDPFHGDTRVGRVRRLYVAPDARRAGVGRALVEAVVRAGSGSFDAIQLRTYDPVADTFYRALGFALVSGCEHATHRLDLPSSE